MKLDFLDEDYSKLITEKENELTVSKNLFSNNFQSNYFDLPPKVNVLFFFLILTTSRILTLKSKLKVLNMLKVQQH